MHEARGLRGFVAGGFVVPKPDPLSAVHIGRTGTADIVADVNSGWFCSEAKGAQIFGWRRSANELMQEVLRRSELYPDDICPDCLRQFKPHLDLIGALGDLIAE